MDLYSLKKERLLIADHEHLTVTSAGQTHIIAFQTIMQLLLDTIIPVPPDVTAIKAIKKPSKPLSPSPSLTPTKISPSLKLSALEKWIFTALFDTWKWRGNAKAFTKLVKRLAKQKNPDLKLEQLEIICAEEFFHDLEHVTETVRPQFDESVTQTLDALQKITENEDLEDSVC